MQLGFRPYWHYTTIEEPSNLTGEKFDVVAESCSVTLGIDIVHTADLIFIGEGAAKYVRKHFPRGMEVSVFAGYKDIQGSDTLLLKGNVMMARRVSLNPLRIAVEIDSPMWKAREDSRTMTGTEPTQADFITSVLSEYSLTANFEGHEDSQADFGGDKEGDFLAYLNKWAKANFIHWLDLMDGNVHFFYPGSKPSIRKDGLRRWELPIRNGTIDNPAVLIEWSPESQYVDAPQTMTLAYYHPELEGEAGKTWKILTEQNERGLPDTTLDLGHFNVASDAEAEAIIKRAADHYYWRSISGPFKIGAGVPVVPLDEITALNGYEGLEEDYDTPMEVTQVRHTLDARGWTVSGRFRAGRRT